MREGLHTRNAHLYMAEFGGPAVTLRGPEAAKIQLLTNPLQTMYEKPLNWVVFPVTVRLLMYSELNTNSNLYTVYWYFDIRVICLMGGGGRRSRRGEV